MQNWGAGSRAVVQVFWKTGGGHVYNVENVDGRIKFIDAQGSNRRAETFLKDTIPVVCYACKDGQFENI